MTQTINLLDRKAANMILFQALVASGDANIVKVAESHPGGANCEIKCTVGGVEVDIVAALEDAWKRAEKHIDEEASKKALEMVTATGLIEFADSIQNINRELRYKMIEKFREAGVELSGDIYDY